MKKRTVKVVRATKAIKAVNVVNSSGAAGSVVTAKKTKTASSEKRLNFVFVEDTFRVDQPKELLSPQDEALKKDFLTNRYKALYMLGFSEASETESPTLHFLRCLSTEFIKVLTDSPELEVARGDLTVELNDDVAEKLLYSVPFCIGQEYIGRAWLSLMFSRLNAVYTREINEYDGSAATYLTEKNQHLRVPERIFFHLVENNKDDIAPFAFLATYATRDKEGVVRHMPLSYALEEFKNERERLLTLLSCLNRAAEKSELISSLMSSGEMFHPLRFSTKEAYSFLKSVPVLEKCGILCRVPNWWKRRYSSISMSVTLGEKKPPVLGFDAIVSMNPSLTAGGVPLTEAEIKRLLKQTEGLAFLKGRWIEVDHAHLREMLREMKKYEGDISLRDALRIEAGMLEEPDIDVGVTVTNGKWLGNLLQQMRRPVTVNQKIPSGVRATLRGYQKTGFQWLDYMSGLGFGACLADDMGLGKTLQVLTWLEKVRKANKNARVLLIVPASLIGNWEKEAAKFTPKIDLIILHGKPSDVLRAELLKDDHFLTITTYGIANRLEELNQRTWDALILDEAQAIKNPGTKQTRAIKKIPASGRIAMTGTPIENDLTNLWSIFDFLNKGLLGTSQEFRNFTKQLETSPDGYQKLRNMVSPFILRRLKTDKSIISDLPEKMEQTDYVSLSKKQIVLYKKQVSELERLFSDNGLSGIRRRGVVLATITKLKQICNHPDQYLGQEAFSPDESGKFAMLREICETIYEKRERVLVFTQYKEITDHLSDFLKAIFGTEGLVLHGGVRVKRRQEMVDEFNGEDYVPYMVLSVKAGGTGLNLTAANHVIHFDRWWNPAVENQATDRAFRIGQRNNVIVHKLVSRGTIEEKIDAMIESKKELADNVIGGTGENWITELNDRELLDIMRLN